MGVLLLAGEIPRRAHRPLTTAIWIRGDSGRGNQLNLVSFGPDQRFEGGPSEQGLNELIAQRLGITLVSPDHELFEDQEDAIREEVSDLQEELWDEAWAGTDSSEQPLAILYGPEREDGDSYNWLDGPNGSWLPANLPRYVFRTYNSRNGSLDLIAGDPRYGRRIPVPAP